MNTFTPLFSQIVDSSLWSEPDSVCKVFITLIAIKDSDHVARINAFALGRKCWPLDVKNAERQVLAALKVLMAPDKTRLEKQPFDGRRIEKVEDGYLILNGQHYEDEMRKVSRKAYKARWERNKRAEKAAPGQDGKPASGAYKAAEKRHSEAMENGNHELADRIAAGEA